MENVSLERYIFDISFKANIFHYTWWSLGRDQAKACERENLWLYYRENADLWSYNRLQIEWETYIMLLNSHFCWACISPLASVGTVHFPCCTSGILGSCLMLYVPGMVPFYQRNPGTSAWDLCHWWLYGLAMGQRKWNGFAKGYRFFTVNIYYQNKCIIFSVASYQTFRVWNIQDLSIDI